MPTHGPLVPYVVEQYKHPFLKGYEPFQKICVTENFIPDWKFSASGAILAIEEGINALFHGYNRWIDPGSIVSQNNLPRRQTDDAVLDTIAAGIALEETKNLLMGWKVSADLISYGAVRGSRKKSSARALVVGAGALGNFAALGLAYSGITDITLMDPDVVEIAT